MPSALSEPRGAIYFCDNCCSEKAVRYWQFASMVVEEVGEARTVNLCQQSFHERWVQQGEPRLNSWAMEGSRGEKGTSWKYLKNHGKRATHTWYVRVFYSQKGRGEEESG